MANELSGDSGELRAAAQAVVDRWDTPFWKDAGFTAVVIQRLRKALAAEPFGDSEELPQAELSDEEIEDAGRRGLGAWSIGFARSIIAADRALRAQAKDKP